MPNNNYIIKMVLCKLNMIVDAKFNTIHRQTETEEVVTACLYIICCTVGPILCSLVSSRVSSIHSNLIGTNH